MHSFLQLVQGIKDLFIMPVEQYQKDGRLMRGFQKGAHSFTSLTAMSLLDFTNKLLGKYSKNTSEHDPVKDH